MIDQTEKVNRRIGYLREAWQNCQCPDRLDEAELSELERQIRAGERP